MNRAIDLIVNATPDLFMPIIIAYLKATIDTTKKGIETGRVKGTKYTAEDGKKIIKHKKATVYRLQNEPKSKYHDEDWAQMLNIIYQIYLFHDPEKRAVKLRFMGDELVSNDVIKAHFDYCCRGFLQTLPDKDQEMGHETITAIINQVNTCKLSLMTVHTILL